MISAKSQNVSIGLRGGLTVPNLSAGSGADVNPLNEGYSSREGLGFGLFAEFRMSKLFSIQPMLEYSQQGGKKNGFQALPTPSEVAPLFQAAGQPVPTYLYADYKSEAKLNYVMFPILAKFGWDLGSKSHWRVYADSGPYAGLLVSAHQVTSGTSSLYLDAQKKQPLVDPQTNQPLPPNNFNETTNIKDQLHKFNLGLEGNAGIAYRFRKNSIFVEIGGDYGLLNIQKGTANGKNHSGAATMMLGYAYRL